jgi:hypothetical protein
MLVTINQEITIYIDDDEVLSYDNNPQIINLNFNYDPAMLLKIIEHVRIVHTDETAFTVYADDWGKMYVTSSDTPVTVTISGDVLWGTGQLIYFQQAGLGEVNLVAGAGVTLQTPDGTSTRTQHSTICIVQTEAKTWVCMGDLSYYA